MGRRQINFYDIGKSLCGRLLLPLAVIFFLVVWQTLSGIDQAFGADGAEGDGLAGFGWRLVNFLIFAGLLVYFGGGKVRDFFAHRKLQVARSIEEAQQAREDAEARYREVMAKLAAADEEIAGLTRSIELQGRLEKEKILAEADMALKRIREEAQARMDQNLALARQQLQAEAAELALALTESLLRERITPEDQDNMVNEFILKMDRSETITETAIRNKMI